MDTGCHADEARGSTGTADRLQALVGLSGACCSWQRGLLSLPAFSPLLRALGVAFLLGLFLTSPP